MEKTAFQFFGKGEGVVLICEKLLVNKKLFYHSVICDLTKDF